MLQPKQLNPLKYGFIFNERFKKHKRRTMTFKKCHNSLFAVKIELFKEITY